MSNVEYNSANRAIFPPIMSRKRTKSNNSNNNNNSVKTYKNLPWIENPKKNKKDEGPWIEESPKKWMEYGVYKRLKNGLDLPNSIITSEGVYRSTGDPVAPYFRQYFALEGHHDIQHTESELKKLYPNPPPKDIHRPRFTRKNRRNRKNRRTTRKN